MMLRGLEADTLPAMIPNAGPSPVTTAECAQLAAVAASGSLNEAQSFAYAQCLATPTTAGGTAAQPAAPGGILDLLMAPGNALVNALGIHHTDMIDSPVIIANLAIYGGLFMLLKK